MHANTLYTYIISDYALVKSFYRCSLFSYFGEVGGMFCSLPLCLAPRCEENHLPVLGPSCLFRPLWRSCVFIPEPLTWAGLSLKVRDDCRGCHLSLGFSDVCLDFSRGSSTILTSSSCSGWLAEEAGGDGEGFWAGGGSLAGLWHTSA